MKKLNIENKSAKKETPKVINPAVQKLVADLNKKHGENSIQIGIQEDSNIVRIPTGSISLTLATGGGLPEGRFTQFSGPLSSTKTSQALHIVREAQKLGYVCAYYDVEGTVTADYFEMLGVDISNILYSRPAGQEECLQSVLDLQKSGIVNLAVIDSLEALSPTKEQDSEMDEVVRMGVKQQLFGEFFRKFTAGNNRLTREGKRPFTLIGLNQLREKMGGYGDPEFVPGGRALGFYASVDIRLRKGDWCIEGKGESKEVVGQTVKFKVEKNKTFKRMTTGEFNFYFAPNSLNVPVGHNDNVNEIIVEAIAWDLIKRTGAWYNYKEHKLNGKNGVIEFLRNNPEEVDALYKEVLKIVESERDELLSRIKVGTRNCRIKRRN